MVTAAINPSVPSSSGPGNRVEQTPALTNRQLAQRQQNLAILESQQLSLSAKNEPLALVLKTAIEGINKELEPFLGENAIESAAERGLDVSPEATAERIVSQSTAFFFAFQQRNNTVDFDQQLEKFLDVIGAGIDQGFAEARDILGSLKVLEGDIATNIDKTYDLVQSGLEDFRQRQTDNNQAAP